MDNNMNKNNIIIIILVFLLCFPIVFSDRNLDKTDSISGAYNYWLESTQDNKISLLIPLMLLGICIICFFIDFGVVGVTIGSDLVLIFGYMLGILYVNWGLLVAFLIVTAILIYKMQQ